MGALGDWLGTIGWKTEVDTSGAEAGVRKAEAEVRESLSRIDRMDAHAEVGMDLRELERDAAKVKAVVAALNRQKIEIEAEIEDLGPLEDVRRGILQKKVADLNKQLKAWGAQQKSIGADTAMLKTLEKQSKALDKETDSVLKATAAREKEIQQLPKLRLQYARLAATRNRLASKKGWQLTVEDRANLAATAADMNTLRDRVHALGGETDDLDTSVDQNRATLSKWASSVASIRLQLGFFSATIRQTAIGVVTLGPIIAEVLGAAGALIGVTGGGLVAAAGVGGAALTGLGLAAFGLVQAFKPAAQEMSAAMTAMTAYDDAVRKYGKHSSEAETAQKNLETTMKNIAPAARKAVEAFGAVRDKFIDLTGPTRSNIFQMMAAGLERAKQLVPDFARNINMLSSDLKGAGNAFLAAFNVEEMRSVMNTIMQNFSKMLPTLGRAFGNIAEGLGNIFAEFSTHFDDVADGLLDWSEGFVKATEDSQSLTSTVDQLMESAESLVHFLGSAGDLMATFFGLGQDAGQDLLGGMTDQMDTWTSMMEANPQGVKQFFADGVEGARDLWEVLKPLGDTFLDVAQAMRPFTSGLLSIAEAFADVISAIADMPGGGALMTALGGLMGGKMLFGALSKLPLIGGLLGGISGPASGAAFSLIEMAEAGTLLSGALLPLAAVLAPLVGVWAALDTELGKAAQSFMKSGYSVSSLTEDFDLLKRTVGGAYVTSLNDIGNAAVTAGVKMRGFGQNIRGAAINAHAFSIIGGQVLGGLMKNLHNVIDDSGETLRRVGLNAVGQVVAGFGTGQQAATQAGRALMNAFMAGIRGMAAGGINAAGDAAKSIFGGIERAKDQVSKKPITINAVDRATPVANKAKGSIEAIPKDHNTNLRGRDGVSGPARAATGAVNAVPTDHNTTIRGDASQAIAQAQTAVAVINAMTATIHVAASVSGMPSGGRYKGGPLTPQPGEIPGYATGGGAITRPMFMVGEEAPKHPEYVIATNPAYRGPNLRYWMEAGKALGIKGFAGGGKMGGYGTGAVGPESAANELTQAQKRYDQAKALKQRREEALDKRKERLEELQKRNRDKDKKNNVGADVIAGAEKDIEKARRELQAAEKALANADEARAKAKAHKKTATAEERKWQGLRDNIGLAEANMSAAAAQGNTADWSHWQKEGLEWIDDLLSELRTASRGATGARKTALQTEIANLITQKQTLGESRPGIEGMLNQSEAAQLSLIQRQQAEAGLTSEITDDRNAAIGLVNFWEKVYGRLSRPGSGATNEMITEAASQLASARESSAFQAGGIIGAGGSQFDIFSRAREDLYKGFGSNIMWQQAAVSPFSGDSAGSGGGGGDTIVNNHFSEPPADPHTWSQQQAFELATM